LGLVVRAVRRASCRLRAQHKTVTFVRVRHEDHWRSRSQMRLRMLRAAVDFLRAHNPPD
jgi:dipeptidyl aminopeptidase/acylaminoacyl peptidase